MHFRSTLCMEVRGQILRVTSQLHLVNAASGTVQLIQVSRFESFQMILLSSPPIGSRRAEIIGACHCI